MRHEGVVLRAYKDVAGLLTIGVGHLLTKSELSSGKLVIDGQVVKWKDGITREQAMALLAQDLREVEDAVERAAGGLTNAQFDALCSFVFNIGIGAFLRSTLLKRIHAGHLEDVPAQMLRWNRAGGIVVAGLQRRRESEAALWGASA